MAKRIGYGEWKENVQLIARVPFSNRSAKKKSRYAHPICPHCNFRHSALYFPKCKRHEIKQEVQNEQA